MANGSQKRQGPANPPPVWAETRQELAESLPYYRAFQSGCYTVGPHAPSANSLKRPASGLQVTKDHTPYAYLLGGFGSERDQWASQGRVVISHGGGHGKTSEEPKGEDEDVDNEATEVRQASTSKHTLFSSQSRSDPRIASLLSSYAHGTPIILIMGENYALADFSLNAGFAVLGWYLITHCWAEKTDQGFVRWKLRFQWLESQGEPWWIAQDGQDRTKPLWNPRQRIEISNPSKPQVCNSEGERKHRNLSATQRLELRATEAARLIKPSKLSSTPCQPLVSADGQVCCYCRESSPIIYDQGWSCLVPECSKGFWALKDSELFYTTAFLQPLPLSSASPTIPFPVQPEEQSSHRAAMIAQSLKGLYCPRCRRLSCREFVAFHRCSHCHWIPTEEDASVLEPPTSPERVMLLRDALVNARFGVKVTRQVQETFEVLTYALPEPFLGSRIHLIQPIKGSATMTTAVDAIFRAMQKRLDLNEQSTKAPEDNDGLWKDVVKLRRHELTMHRSTANGSKARLLTQMFTCNIGEDYKHSTATRTIPMTESPRCVLDAQTLIEKMTSLVTELEQPFNELYPCAYGENMVMNWHDDGEPGLGKIVSSLSLGTEATMSFRLKKKFACDTKVKGESTARSTTESASPQSKKNLTILQGYKEAQKKAVQTLAIPAHDRKILSLPVRHGSVVVQEGAALQECIEHCVVPAWDNERSSGGLRFAVTARRIN